MLDGLTARRPINPYARRRREVPGRYEVMLEATTQNRDEIVEKIRTMPTRQVSEFYLRMVGSDRDAFVHSLTEGEFEFMTVLAAQMIDEARLELAEEA